MAVQRRVVKATPTSQARVCRGRRLLHGHGRVPEERVHLGYVIDTAGCSHSKTARTDQAKGLLALGDQASLGLDPGRPCLTRKRITAAAAIQSYAR
jgi:hypothetical protein